MNNIRFLHLQRILRMFSTLNFHTFPNGINGGSSYSRFKKRDPHFAGKNWVARISRILVSQKTVTSHLGRKKHDFRDIPTPHRAEPSFPINRISKPWLMASHWPHSSRLPCFVFLLQQLQSFSVKCLSSGGVLLLLFLLEMIQQCVDFSNLFVVIRKLIVKTYRYMIDVNEHIQYHVYTC